MLSEALNSVSSSKLLFGADMMTVYRRAQFWPAQMFTGIVTDIGEVQASSGRHASHRLRL